MSSARRLQHRRSIRLRDYDYAQAGAYFVTICTQNRECLFGDVIDDQIRLNDAGRMVQTVWGELPTHYQGVDIDRCVVMPNHLHGIIVITPVGAAPRGRPSSGPANPLSGRERPPSERAQGPSGQARGPAPTGLSLFDVVHRLKTMTTKRYVDGVKTSGWPAFPGRLWQRNYYEHVIRDEDALTRIREYIVNNPQQWALDRENPANGAQ